MSIATKSTRTSPFKRFRAHTDIERAARQIAGTVFAGLGRSQLETLLKRDGDEILAALGLHCDDDPEVFETHKGRVSPPVYAAIFSEAKRLADAQVVVVHPLDRNLDVLVQALDLDGLERAVLRAGALSVLQSAAPLTDRTSSHAPRATSSAGDSQNSAVACAAHVASAASRRIHGRARCARGHSLRERRLRVPHSD